MAEVIGIDSRDQALLIANFAQDKKAEDVVILDMRKISNITDFFIICSGNSTRQVKAIADHIGQQLKRAARPLRHIEGYQHALWVLLDCGAVVAHIFHQPTRQFYDLERLWGDLPRIKI